ncbi:MAG: type IV secretion system protein [Bacteroidota bacterium]|nr:type IV secretion system protein [Bacteroidota bacterium]
MRKDFFKWIFSSVLTLCFLISSNNVLANGDGTNNTGGGTNNTNNLNNIGQQQEADMLDFMRGGGDLESWFMDTFMEINKNVAQYADDVAPLGKAIGGFGMLIYLGVLGWKMQEGDAWRVEPLIKPIILGLIIMNWSSFISLVQSPFIILSEPAKGKFEEIKEEVDALRVEKYKKTKILIDELYKLKVKEATENPNNLGFLEAVVTGEMDEYVNQEFTNNVLVPLKTFEMKFNLEVQNALMMLVTFVGLAILRVAVYGIFFIQIIWSMILVIVGPIAVGFSMIPGFDNSFNNWLAKFINVNLYGFVGYIVVSLGQMMIIGSYEMELHRIRAIIPDEGGVNELLLANYAIDGGIFMTGIFTVVGYLVTAVGMFMVPTIADSIISAGGAGIMTKGKNAARAVQMGAKAVATKGASLAKDMGKEAIKNIKDTKAALKG